MLILFYRVKEIFYLFLVLVLCVLGTITAANTHSVKNAFMENREKYIVVIIDDYGYNGEGTDEMLEIGIPVTAAIMPGMSSSQVDAEKYYAAGFDVILHQPMEPKKGPGPWLGPYALTSGLSDEQIDENVNKALESVKFAIGINNHMGSEIMENKRIISRVIHIASEKNLIFIDSKTTGKSVAGELAQKEGISFYERDVFLDSIKSVENTRKQLRRAAEIADKKGYAIVIGHVGTAGGKTTVRGIKEEAQTLIENGYDFITISDLDMRLNLGLTR